MMEDEEYVPEVSTVLAQSNKTLKQLVAAKMDCEAQTTALVTQENAPNALAVNSDGVSDDFEQDFLTTKKNTAELIAKANKTLTTLLTIAGSDENPRAFEVANQIMNTIADLNSSVIELHERKKKFKEVPATNGQPQAGSTVNNTMFVGSTEDALALIEKMKSSDGEQNVISSN